MQGEKHRGILDLIKNTQQQTKHHHHAKDKNWRYW